MNSVPKLVEGVHYTVGPDGLLVFTASYLLARGYCCKNGCRNCPYPKNSPPQESRAFSGKTAQIPPTSG